MVKMNEEKQYCYKYPHPSITTDCVIFGYDVKDGLSLLLIERKAEPFKGRWRSLEALCILMKIQNLVLEERCKKELHLQQLCWNSWAAIVMSIATLVSV